MQLKRNPINPGFIKVDDTQNLYQLCEVSISNNEIILKILESA